MTVQLATTSPAGGMVTWLGLYPPGSGRLTDAGSRLVPQRGHFCVIKVPFLRFTFWTPPGNLHPVPRALPRARPWTRL